MCVRIESLTPTIKTCLSKGLEIDKVEGLEAQNWIESRIYVIPGFLGGR